MSEVQECCKSAEPTDIHYRRIAGEYISEPCCQIYECRECGRMWKECDGVLDD